MWRWAAIALVWVGGCYGSVAPEVPDGAVEAPPYVTLLKHVARARELRCACDPRYCLPSIEMTTDRMTCVAGVDLGASGPIVVRQARAMGAYATCLEACGACEIGDGVSSLCTTAECSDDLGRVDADVARCLEQ